MIEFYFIGVFLALTTSFTLFFFIHRQDFTLGHLFMITFLSLIGSWLCFLMHVAIIVEMNLDYVIFKAEKKEDAKQAIGEVGE